MVAKKNSIEAALKECELHLKRLHNVQINLSKVFPLTVQSYEHLDEAIITFLDQFLFRFMKLQDALGTKLFPVFANLITGIDDPRPFIDTLNILEKSRIISSSEEWQELRVIRNTIAYDYPDTADQTVAALNQLMHRWMILDSMFISIKDYYFSKLSGSIS
jgi:hypothetical protein